MLPQTELQQRLRLNAFAGWSIFSAVALLVALLITVEFAVEFGFAAPPAYYVAADDPFELQQHNPHYSAVYDDGKVVYGTQTHAPDDATEVRHNAFAELRDRIQQNRAQRRGSRSDVPFMHRGPVRRVIAWMGSGAWRLLRPRGVFVHLVPASSVSLHGFLVVPPID